MDISKEAVEFMDIAIGAIQMRIVDRDSDLV